MQLTDREIGAVELFHFPQLPGTESTKSQSDFFPTGTYRTSSACSECSASSPMDWGRVPTFWPLTWRVPTFWPLTFAHFTPLDSLMLGYKRNVTYSEMLRDLRPLWRLLYSAVQSRCRLGRYWLRYNGIWCDCEGGDKEILVLYTNINCYLVLGGDDSWRLGCRKCLLGCTAFGTLRT
jgi:hypothetical protein